MPTASPDTYESLFWGYTALWAVLALFVLRLMRETSRLRSDLAHLKEQGKKHSHTSGRE